MGKTQGKQGFQLTDSRSAGTRVTGMATREMLVHGHELLNTKAWLLSEPSGQGTTNLISFLFFSLSCRVSASSHPRQGDVTHGCMLRPTGTVVVAGTQALTGSLRRP